MVSQQQLRLERLIVENFKSYRGRHEIGPFERLTAVVGPNGSGKSNLMDAISFALGVQSRQMRSANLSALIYKPSCPDEAPPSSASVSLVFQWPDEGRRQVFKRSVARSSGSSYAVDDEAVTAVEFTEALRRLNILVKARNFLVFQGDVVDVARRTPAELGHLFEQISGSDLLQEQFELQESEVAAASAELRLRLVQRQKIAATLQRLQGEVAQAKHHAELKRQLGDAESSLLVAELYLNDCRAREAKEKFEALQATKMEVTTARQAAEESLRLCDSAVVAAEGRAVAATRQQDALAAQSASVEEERNVLLSKQTFESKRRVELQSAQEELHLKGERLRELLEEKQQALEVVQQKLRESKAAQKQNRQRQQKGNRYSQEVVARYEELRQAAVIKTSRIEAAVAAKQSSLAAAERKLKTATDLKLQAQRRAEELRRSIAATETAVTTAAAEAENIERRVREADDHLQQARDRAAAESQHVSLLQSQKAQLENQLHYLQANQHESNAARRRRETVERLQREVPQVHGLMADLCRPAVRKHKLAVAVALGKFADHVVVETFEAGRAAIKVLKGLKLPPLDFLPLDTVVHSAVPRGIRDLPDAKLALDCIVFDSHLEPAFAAALGSTVIVEDLQQAERVAFKDAPARGISVKAVTVDGDRILKNGNFTVEASGRGGRAHAGGDVKEISDLQQQLRELDHQLRSSSVEMAELPGARSTCETLQVQLAQLQQEVTARMSRARQLRRQLAENETWAESQDTAVQETEKAVESLTAELQELEAECRRIQSEVFEPLGKEVDIVELKQQEEADKIAARRSKQEAEALTFQLGRLQAECDALQSQLSQVAKSSNDCETRSCLATLKQLEAALGKTAGRRTQLQADLAEAEKNVNAAVADVARSKREAATAVQALQEITHKLQKIHALESKAHEDLEILTAEAMEMLRRSLLRHVHIPLTRGRIETFAQWCGVDEGTSQAAEFAAARDDDEEAPEVHYAACLSQQELAAAHSDSELLLRPRRAAVAELQEQLSAVPANPAAIERHDVLTGELKSAEEEVQRLENKKKKAERNFQAIRRERVRRFMNCFNHAKAAVEETYPALTETASNGTEDEEEDERLGGEAFLELQEQPAAGNAYINTAVQFNVMPPSKRFSDMRRLSGGEKTIAALALLFALQSYNAAPFFVLDEIDAALDPVNVEALARYLRGVDYQVILISHSDRLFSQADRLIGIYVNSVKESSETLTLSLLDFAAATPPLAVQ